MIIGQGLAGSLLGWELNKAGQSIMIIDDGHRSASSHVAAGMVNPLAGKRLALYPETKAHLDAVQQTYAEIEASLNRQYYHPTPLLRILQNEDEASRFGQRQNIRDFAEYIAEAYPAGKPVEGMVNPHGAFYTEQGGWLNTRALIKDMRKYFDQNKCLLETPFEANDLVVDAHAVHWNNKITARQVIFCQGWRDSQNPWFDWLRWDPVQGDIMTLDCPGIRGNRIINGGKWLVPTDGDLFKAGSTYQRNRLDQRPSARDGKTVLEGVRALTGTNSLKVIRHEAGIRPGTRTQHPFIGLHPRYENIGLFSGFGSKGTLLIPLYANKFTRHLLNQTPIPNHVNIRNQWRPSPNNP